jgi:hypothetical protein
MNTGIICVPDMCASLPVLAQIFWYGLSGHFYLPSGNLDMLNVKHLVSADSESAPDKSDSEGRSIPPFEDRWHRKP